MKTTFFLAAALMGSISYGQTQIKDPAGTATTQIVIVTDELDCYACRTDKQASSAASIALSPSVDVYPNPANANVSITISLKQDQHATFQIHDLRGRFVLEHALTDASTQVFSTEQLNEGIYLYNVQVNSTDVKSGKLSIIH